VAAEFAFPGYVRMLAFLHRNVPPLFARFSARQVAQFRTIRRPPAQDSDSLHGH
jgi:hypothetical protein